MGMELAAEGVRSLEPAQSDWVSAVALPFGGLIAAIFVACAIYIEGSKYRTRRLLKGHVPVLGGIPVFGLVRLAATVTSNEILYRIMKEYNEKYPKGVSLWAAHRHWIIMPDLKTIEAILTSPYAVEKGVEYQFLKPLYIGVFIAKADKWRRMRRSFAPAFASRTLDYHTDIIDKQSKVFIEVVNKRHQGFDNMLPYVRRYFIDICTRSFFHSESEEQSKHYNRDVISYGSRFMERVITERAFKILRYFDFYFHRTTDYQTLLVLAKKYHQVVSEIAAKRFPEWQKLQQTGVKGKKEIPHYMDLTFEVMDELKMEHTHENHTLMSADLFQGATDTTSITTTTLMYFLAVYPEWGKKVQQEVDEVWEQSSDGRLNRQLLGNLPLLDMCLKETLRLVCPPGILRRIVDDLPVGDYTIPGGANVYISILHLHTSPEYWERPTEFYPEHFLPEKCESRPRMAYLPFSFGPRNCPGTAYAYLAMKSLLCHVLKDFTVETNLPKDEVKYKVIFMREHVQKYPIRLVPRKR